MQGKILRKGYTYTRSNGTQVKVSGKYIKDKGLPGKGPKIFPPLKKGVLKTYGYSSNKSDISRHRSLNKAVKKEGYSDIIKRLNVISILLKNTVPEKSKIFRKDISYLQKNR